MKEAEFNSPKYDRKLELSERMRQVWGWVGAKAVGDTFYGIQASDELRIDQSTARRHLLSLDELGAIGRQQLLPHIRVDAAPFEKLDSPLWTPIHELLVKHGVEVVPVET